MPFGTFILDGKGTVKRTEVRPSKRGVSEKDSKEGYKADISYYEKKAQKEKERLASI